jgi:hypothetical protein
VYAGANGNYFNMMDRMWLFAGESSDQQARTDLITATTAMVNSNSTGLTATGYTGNTSSMSLDPATRRPSAASTTPERCVVNCLL